MFPCHDILVYLEDTVRDFYCNRVLITCGNKADGN